MTDPVPSRMNLLVGTGLLASLLLTASVAASSWLSPWFGPTTVGWWLLPLGVAACLMLMMGSSQLWQPARVCWLVGGVTLTMLLALVVSQTGLRRTSHNSLPLHDGALQTESAARFVFQGVDPYGANYRATPIGHISSAAYSSRGQVGNAAWDHYAYPPAVILLTAPFVWLGDWTQGWIDSRWVAVVALLLAVAAMMRRRSWSSRMLIVLLTIGNPLIIFPVVAGYNDVLVGTAVVFAVLAWQEKHWLQTGVWMAVAVGCKQLAWTLVVWWVVAMCWQWRRGVLSSRQAWRVLGSFGLVGLMIFGPFVLWNPTAFWHDVVRYVSGVVDATSPIAGATLWKYVRLWSDSASAWAAVPVTMAQLAVGAVVSVWVGRQLWRSLTPRTWLWTGTVLTLAIMLVSRVVWINYFVPLFLWILLVAEWPPSVASSGESSILPA